MKGLPYAGRRNALDRPHNLPACSCADAGVDPDEAGDALYSARFSGGLPHP